MPATHASLGTAVNPPAAQASGCHMTCSAITCGHWPHATGARRPETSDTVQGSHRPTNTWGESDRQLGPTRVDRANLVGGDAQQIPLPRTIVISGARPMCQSYHRGLTAPACVLDGFSCSV